jgi:hypothetical protein
MVIARLLRALRRRSAPALQRLYNLRYWGLLTVFVFVTSVGVFYTRASAPTRVYAATSSTLNFQGRLLNSNGSLISDTSTAQIRFKIYDGGTQGGPAGTGQANSGTGGTFLWSEVQSNIRIVNGYFSVNLGSQTAFPNTIDWSQELWLTMDVYNGAAYDGEMTNANLRMKLTAVPYAFRAGQADSLTDGTSSITAANLLQKAPVTIQTVNAGVAGLRFNQTGAGGLIQIQADSSDIFTVSKTGNAFLGGLLNIDGASLDIGSNSLAGTLILNDGSNNTGSVLTAALSANRTYTLPDSDGVICLTTTCAGGANGFIQGGNSFGGLATLGTNDNFDLNFETNGITKLTVSTAGDLTFAQGANRTLSVAQASSGTGNNLTIVAGQSSTGANNGGNLILQAGASGGSGSTGSVIVKANGTDSATAFQIQRAAATDVLTVDTANSTTLLRGINSSASLGANLITSQDFTDTTYWSCSGWTTTTSDATHNTGNTTACSVTATNMTVVAGTTYFIEFMLDGNSSAENTVTPSIGGVSGVPIGQIGMNSHSVTINAGNTSALTFTPTNSFNGTISNIVVRAITTTKPVLQVKNSGGTVSMEIRASNITSNSFIGLRAGLSNTTGFDNTALGTGALQGNTTGYENTAIGASALFNNTTGSDNTALGAYALYSNTTGNQNLALGPYALYGNTTGFENIAIGQSALLNNTTGYYNTALGSRALGDNTTGSNNIAIGYYALMYNTTGYGNTVIGDSAGFQDPSVSSFVTPGNLSNATALGYGAQVQASNSLILGGQGTNAVNVGIGTTVPKNTLSVSPLQYSTGTVSQSGTTITGTGTTFTSAMVGGELIFASGNKVTITGFTNATTLTVTPSQTIVEQAYRIHYVGLQVTNSGNVGIGVLNPLARLEVTASNGGSQKTLVVNNSTSTGNILEVQDNGTPVFTIADGGLVALTQLGSADNNTVLCRNAANQIATCTNNFATTTSAFVQGGNSFGAEAVLGTNDNNALSFETNGLTRLTVQADGDLVVDTNTLFVDAANDRVGIGTTAPDSSLHINKTGAAELRLTSDASWPLILKQNSSSVFSLTNGGVERLTLDADGATTLLPASSQTGAFKIQAQDTGLQLFNVDASNRLIVNNGTKAAGNELENPGFESLCNGWDSACSATTTNPRTGNRAATQSGVADSMALKFIRVEPGQQLYYEGYVRTALAGSGTGGFFIECRDKDYLNPSFSTGDTWTAPGTTYALRTNTYTVPAGKPYCRIATTTRTGNTDTWYFDDLYFARITEQAPQIFKNSVDTITAFQVQNAAGASLITSSTSTTAASLAVTATASSSQKTLVVNNSTSTGNILEVQDNGTPVFTIADGGLVALTQLGSADNNTVLCRNAANQIATCTNNFATTTSAFVQGGNSFGAEAVLGTNDNNALSFETNGTTKLTILANGNVGIGTSGTPAALLSIGGSTGNLTIDSSGNLTTSGTYNTNTFSATNLTFGGASGTISTTSNGNLTLAPNGSGVLGLNTGSTGLLTTNASTIRRTATGTTTFDLLDSGDTTLAFTNSGAGVLNLTVDGNGTFATGLTVSAGGASLTGGLNNNSGNITNAGSITGVGANITGTGALTLASGGSGALTLDSASNILVLADDTLQRASSGLTIDVNNAGLSTLNIANNNGSNLANLDVEGGIFAGTGNAFTVNSDGDVIAAFTLLNGTSTTNGAALVASTSLVLNDASNFDVGNYVQVNSTNCGGTGVNVCYAKITAKATNTLTITPALTWANASTVNEYHVPELGGTNTGSTLASRYGRGYFIAGVATGNGTTYYNEDSITTSLTNFNLLNTGATTLNIGGAATSLNLGASGGTVTIAGNITVNGVISGAGPSSGTSGFFTRSGTTLSTANAGDSLSITGTLSGLSGLTVSSGGASITGGLNNNSGGITSAGSIAGATTLSLSGAITGATATNTINGLVVNSGALSSVTGITFTSGGLNLNNGGIINAGSLTGVGANITATAGLTIASGGSAALTLDSASNTLLIAGTDTAIQRTATGTLTIDLADAGVTTLALNNTLAGAASLNLVDGGLQVAGTSVLTNGRALQNLTGLTVASGGANITGNSTIVGTLGSITTLTAQTINATTSYQINGTAGTSRTCANNQFVGGQTITNGITTATNNCTAPALSDERVKENVASIDTAVLDRLKNVRAVTFDFKCNNPLYENAGMDCYSGRQTGVIAQEIAQIFPDLVYQDSNGYYNVKYQGLSIYTLKAVSELAARVDSIGSGNGGNANEVSTGGVLRLDANGALQNINGLNMTGGSASIIGGLNLNGSGINNAGEIKGVTNIFATSLTLNASGNQNLLTLFKDGNEVFTIFNDGALRIRTNSTRSFAIESADGRTHFNVDTFGNLVSIGSQNGDDKAILFALDTKNTAGDPTGVNGASYYNSDAGKFRCFQDGRWQDCLPAAYAEYVLLATQAKWQQPQGESEFSGEPRTWVDLSSAREFRMIMRVTQAAPNGTTCKLQFATTEDGPWADLFEGDANLKTDTTGSLKTDWKRIREDARTEVILRVMCSSAQTNSNPELGGIRIQLR